MLLLLPQRNLALRVVSRLVALAVKETRSDTIQNKQRFLEEFGDDTGAGCGVRSAGCGVRGAGWQFRSMQSGSMQDWGPRAVGSWRPLRACLPNPTAVLFLLCRGG